MECRTCRSNTGEKRISPGPTIFEGESWLVEHAYPVKTIGWLVIVLKRHAEMEHFRHIHIHIFARPAGFPDELKGGKSFALLKVTPEEAVTPIKIISFYELLRENLSTRLKSNTPLTPR